MSGIILAYVLLITFISIPEKNQRFVDITLAFLLGVLSNASSYLTGGNPQKKAPEIGNTTAEISATITKAPEE